MRIALLALAGCGGAAAPAVVSNEPERTGKTAADYYAESVKLDHIECPAGTTQEGEDPPHGTYAYCVLPDGTYHGPWMTWPGAGYPRKIGIHDHNEFIRWTAWHMSNDELATVHADGRRMHWHDNGQLASDCAYVDDVPSGYCPAWDRDGALISDTTMDHGTGTIVTWDEEIRIEEHWRNGFLDGEVRRWYANGEIASVATYHDGELGELHEFYPSGAKRRDRIGGQETEWDEQGNELEPMCAHGPCSYDPE